MGGQDRAQLIIVIILIIIVIIITVDIIIMMSRFCWIWTFFRISEFTFGDHLRGLRDFTLHNVVITIRFLVWLKNQRCLALLDLALDRALALVRSLRHWY